MTPTKRNAADTARRRYASLVQRLAKTGFVLQGTITERRIQRQDPAHPGHDKPYGPYYQWTMKREGKTVTVNLTAAQARAYGRAIAEYRKLEHTLDQMRALALEILEATTPGVSKRKPRQ